MDSTILPEAGRQTHFRSDFSEKKEEAQPIPHVGLPEEIAKYCALVLRRQSKLRIAPLTSDDRG